MWNTARTTVASTLLVLSAVGCSVVVLGDGEIVATPLHKSTSTPVATATALPSPTATVPAVTGGVVSRYSPVLTLSGTGTTQRTVTFGPGIYTITFSISGNERCSDDNCFGGRFSVTLEDHYFVHPLFLGIASDATHEGSLAIRGLRAKEFFLDVETIKSTAEWEVTFRRAG